MYFLLSHKCLGASAIFLSWPPIVSRPERPQEDLSIWRSFSCSKKKTGRLASKPHVPGDSAIVTSLGWWVLRDTRKSMAKSSDLQIGDFHLVVVAASGLLYVGFKFHLEGWTWRCFHLFFGGHAANLVVGDEICDSFLLVVVVVVVVVVVCCCYRCSCWWCWWRRLHTASHYTVTFSHVLQRGSKQ